MKPKPTNFADLIYLESGSEMQQRGIVAIRKSGVFDILKPFDPVLAGTLPLDLFTPTSDLDILCYAPDPLTFFDFAKSALGHFEKFRIYQVIINGEEAIIVNFFFGGFAFEVFAQKIPVTEQTAYRHLLIEHQILQQQGESFREKVMDLKLKGVKTEPAFAYVLQLKGDPYEALLHYLPPD
ncbi:MAG: DUF4269 domain-containing protein [Bacteroidota bacterium]